MTDSPEDLQRKLDEANKQIASLKNKIAKPRKIRERMINRLRRVDPLIIRMKKTIHITQRIHPGNSEVYLDVDFFGGAVSALFFQNFEPSDIDVRVAIRGVNLRRGEMYSVIMQILCLIKSMDDKLTKIESGKKSKYRDLNVIAIEYDGVLLDLLVENTYAASPESDVTSMFLDSNGNLQFRLKIGCHTPTGYLQRLYQIANGDAIWTAPRIEHLQDFDPYHLLRLEKLVKKGFQVDYFFISGAHRPLTCPICQEDNQNLVLACGHYICMECANKSIKHHNFRCSICRERMTLLLKDRGLNAIESEGLREEIANSFE